MQLTDEDPALVARAILFMYGGSYPTTNISGSPQHPECHQFTTIEDIYHDERFENSQFFLHRLCLHTLMYALGDKYGMVALKDYSRYRFLLAFTGNDENDPGEETEWDDDDILEAMKAEDDDVWQELAPIIKLVYSTTPDSDRGLRNIVVQLVLLRTWRTHLSMILELPAFRDLLMDLPELQWEMITMPISMRQYDCTSCKDGDTVLTIAQKCACGKIGSCRKRQCAESAMKNTFCVNCLTLDCIMLQDEELDDDNEAKLLSSYEAGDEAKERANNLDN